MRENTCERRAWHTVGIMVSVCGNSDAAPARIPSFLTSPHLLAQPRRLCLSQPGSTGLFFPEAMRGPFGPGVCKAGAHLRKSIFLLRGLKYFISVVEAHHMNFTTLTMCKGTVQAVSVACVHTVVQQIFRTCLSRQTSTVHPEQNLPISRLPQPLAITHLCLYEFDYFRDSV